jgi:mono/diheme cytochrome c family protein
MKSDRKSFHIKWLPIALGIFLFAWSTVWVSAAPATQSAEQGQALFEQKCKGCHTIGGGNLVGPDLQGVTLRRDPAWIKAFIADPGKVIASGDPIAKKLVSEHNNMQMPNLGLSQTDIEALLAYFETQTGQAPAQAQPATSPSGAAPPSAAGSQPALPAGDPAAGQALFLGELRLVNGGPACVSCHTVGKVGALGGGRLGPDLTQVYARYGGQAGMASTLASLPFPTMQGAFATRPLSPLEQSDLLAFFAQANQQNPVVATTWSAQVTNWFLMFAGGGLVLLLGVLFYFWLPQRQNLSDRLRAGTWPRR